MDTKSRNIKYSFVTKAIAVFLLWISFAGLFAGAVFLVRYYDEIVKENYYESYRFINTFRNYVNSAISSDEMKELLGNAAEPVFNANEVTGYNADSAVNFKYVVRNTQTDDVVTNMELEGESVLKAAKEFSKNKSYLFYSMADKKSSFNNVQYPWPDNRIYLNDLADQWNNAPIELYATVDDQLKPGDVFYVIQQEHKKVYDMIPMFLIIAIAALALGLCSFIYLAAVTGRNAKDKEVKPALIDWLYNDLHTAAVVLAAMLSIGAANWAAGSFSDDISKGIGVFVILSIDMLIGLSYILSMIRHIKRRTLFRHTLVYSLFKATAHILVQCFAAKTFKPAIILLLLAYGGLNAILFAIATHLYSGGFWFVILMLVVLNIVAIYYVSKALTSLSGIMKWVKEMTKGNLEHALDTANMSVAFAVFAEDIGSLQTGIKQAVSEAVKGERLKTELITNVSHDLKTPLTSIINYVDLLKKENLDNETVDEYISVLEDKSARLKQLVDDLLEASKAASGDMIVNFGSIDLCALAEQSAAEFSEKAAEAGLDVRIKLCEKPAMVHGDGTLMWRIMDNLLSNVVKYSQKNSRVYINIEDTGTSGVITVKNISEAALDISSEQLLERFVRGDLSRSTEGSGLGLSIAKSLAELQGGTLELRVDGDLFKVIVSLPLERSEGNFSDV